MSLSLRVQRHAPCPCGSRRKLAACCLPWEEAFHRLMARLVTFAATPPVSRQAEDAAAIFWNTERPIQPGKGQAAAGSLRFLEWFLQDYLPRRARAPLLGEFADGAAGLSLQEEDLLFGLLRSPVRAYEVTEVLGHRGVTLKDLVGGGENLVGPLGPGDPPIRSDVLVCRLLPLGRLTRPGAGLLLLPAECRGEMLAYLRTAYQLARPARHISLEDFLDSSAYLYHHFFLLRGRSLGGRARETLRRATFALGQVTYRATDARRIQAGLDRQQELERGEGAGTEIRYVWIDPERAIGRATLLVRAGEVTVTADTSEDLADARRFLETCLRGLIHPLVERRTESTPDAPRTPPRELARTGPRPGGAAFFARILDRWPDTPSPLLNDRTPRQACGSRAGRQQVAALLLSLERDFARQKRLGRAWADVTPLREQLDLLPVVSSGPTR